MQGCCSSTGRSAKNGFPNCASLAKEWEVNERTIRRDLDYLRYQLDAPLAYSALKRGYMYTEEQYQLPAIQIRERDLFALYLADKLLAQYEGTPIYDSLKSVFTKIEDSLPDKVSFSPGSEQTLFTVIPPSATVILPEVLETVFSAVRSATTTRHLLSKPWQGARRADHRSLSLRALRGRLVRAGLLPSPAGDPHLQPGADSRPAGKWAAL